MSVGEQKSGFSQWAAFASIGAGIIHGAAIGLHAEHAGSSRVFLLLTMLQVAWGVAALSGVKTVHVLTGAAINGGAIVGWIITRYVGISFISGFEIPENPQPADTICAILAAIAVMASIVAWKKPSVVVSRVASQNSVYVCAAVTLLGLWTMTGHAHSHGVLELTDSVLTVNADGVIVAPGETQQVSTTTTIAGDVNTSGTKNVDESTSTTLKRSPVKTTTTTVSPTTTSHAHTTTRDQQLAMASGWPRAFDPAAPIDFSGIGGVTSEQAQRATTLIQANARDLAKFATTAAAEAAGYKSIGDGSSGFEHFVNQSLLNDGRMLDTNAPESLVYRVASGTKTLVSAMYIANQGTLITDSVLNNYAGGLMQWHVHDNLCWWADAKGNPIVVGVTDANGNCSRGVLQKGGAPMVHVWLAAHQCGPFAAVEGVAAGISDVPDSQRVDLCNRH